jgi:hypothetical protein
VVRRAIRGIATSVPDARRLVERAEDSGRERGTTVALLDTGADSPLSVPFWRSVSYTPRSIVFRKDL